MSAKEFLKTWFKDFWGIAYFEFRQILSDSGVMLIFVVACLAYPLLYNVVYINGLLDDTPIAVVDEAACSASRRYIREVDATREVRVAYKCINMAEAEKLMQERKVKGIVYFPSDFGDKLARMESATISVYCDMSAFLYYKNALMSVNHVMLAELGDIQLQRYAMAGITGEAANQIVSPVPYEENNPYNSAFAYNYFLISVILLIIIQQTMFYGMSLLVGTARENNKSFASLPDRLSGRGVGRVVLGRGAAYWVLYLPIAMYIAYIVPGIFGIPQRGNFWDILILLMFFLTDCVFMSMAWSSVITRRESVFVLFLFISPICVFLTGIPWPEVAMPKFWRIFSYIFPSTFACKAYINVNTAGGLLSENHDLIWAMTIQTIVYYVLASVAIYVENWVLKHREEIRLRRELVAATLGYDKEANLRDIGGDDAVDAWKNRK